MSIRAEIRSKTRELPVRERLELAREILDIGDDQISEAEADEMWEQILIRRSEEMKQPGFVGVTRQELMRRIDELLAERRRS